MGDGTTKANPWQAVCEAMVTHVLRALQVIYDDFNVSLEQRLNDVLQHPIAEDWRGEVAAFVDETERKGLRIFPESVRVIEALIESRIAGTGQFAQFGPAARAPARGATPAARSTMVAPAAETQAIGRGDQVELPSYPAIQTAYGLEASDSTSAEQLFDQQLASARNHLNTVQQLLEVAGEKIDAAKPGEEVDVEYEAAMVEKHLFLYHEDLIVARDLWLRFNLSGDANSRLIAMPTPVGLGLPMFVRLELAERVRRQEAAIGRRLSGRSDALDATVTGLEVGEAVANATSLVAAAGIVIVAAKKGGTWAVVKTVGIGVGIYLDTKVAETALHNAGASDQAIRGAELAAAVITLMLLRRVPKTAATLTPAPKSQAGVGEAPLASELAGPPPRTPGGSPPRKPGGPSPAEPAGAPPKVPPLRSTNARDAINEITEIVAKTTGDGATKAAQVKALLEQAAKQGITGEGGTPIRFDPVKGTDGSDIFLGGFNDAGVRHAIVISPRGEVFRGGSSLTGSRGVTHFQLRYTPNYNVLKKQ